MIGFIPFMLHNPSATKDSEPPSNNVGGAQEQTPGRTEPETTEATPSVHSSNIDPSLLGNQGPSYQRANEERFLHALIAALSKLPYPPAASGTTVEQAFRTHLMSLSPKENKQQSFSPDTPSLYSVMKTFWLPSSPSYFSLTSSASTSRIPSEHRFIYWDPLPLLFNGLACPTCAAPLANKGRIQTGPIMVHDLEKPFYIIGCKYECMNSDCKTGSGNSPSTYASTDGRILRALPEVLKKEFPAHLAKSVKANDVVEGELGPDDTVWSFKVLGVSTALWNLVRGLVALGMGEAAIMSILIGLREGHVELPKALPFIGRSNQEEPRLSGRKRHITQQVYVELPKPRSSSSQLTSEVSICFISL